MTKVKAVVYARVSTNHDNQIHSFKSQQEYYSEYAQKNGYDLVKIYADEGLTATSANRKEFLQMLYDAGLKYEIEDGLVTVRNDREREPKFNWIILKDVSRFARNLNAIEIARRLREKGVFIQFENMSFTTKDSDWEFRLGLFLTFTQQESIDRSIKSKKAYDIRSQKGVYHMPNVLFGYQKNPETKDYEINKNEAQVVRDIFDLYVNHGKGTYQIAAILNEKGYVTKKGNNFDGNAVLRIIKNEKYKGQIVLKKHTYTDITGSHKRVKLPQNEHIKHEDAIPKIVSVEMFDKAQEIMEQRLRKTKGGTKGIKLPENDFYKKIFCGKCGADYIRTSANKIRYGEKVREYFYMCRNRKDKKQVTKCTNKGISHKVLLRELTRIGKELPSSFAFYQMVDEKQTLDTILENLDNKLKNSLSNKDEIRSKITELDKQIENVTSSLASGVPESVQKVLLEKIEKIESEKAELNEKLLSYDTISIENQKQEYIDKYHEIEKFSKKEEFTYDEILSVLHKIDILEHRTALVEIKTPTLQDDDYIYKGETDNALVPFTFKLR
ncbi:recombinase family protein [Halobacillus andaensis]|uniref:recombinase family protein n=1 Tax=Halobacillus andaensis TaxID=1176239 RepID=UPI003D73F505